MQRQGIKPDAITYSALISACETGADLKQAMHVFKIMQRQGISPDPIAYNALIRACEKGCNLPTALELCVDL